MAKGSEYYRESELKRFTRIGILAIVGLALVGFSLRQIASEKMGTLNPHPHSTTFSEPVSTGSLPAR